MRRKNNKDNMKICLVGSSGGHLTHLYMDYYRKMVDYQAKITK